MSTALTLGGLWYQEGIKTYEVPSVARHGVVLPISRAACDKLFEEFPP